MNGIIAITLLAGSLAIVGAAAAPSVDHTKCVFQAMPEPIAESKLVKSDDGYAMAELAGYIKYSNSYLPISLETVIVGSQNRDFLSLETNCSTFGLIVRHRDDTSSLERFDVQFNSPEGEKYCTVEQPASIISWATDLFHYKTRPSQDIALTLKCTPCDKFGQKIKGSDIDLLFRNLEFELGGEEAHKRDEFHLPGYQTRA